MRYLAASFLALAGFGCSSEDAAEGGSANEQLSFHYEADIDAGDEIQKCRFTAMPSDRGELAIGNISHTYTAGSHHFLIYRTELTEMPAGGEELVDCDESGWMNHVRGVVYAAQETKGRFELPPAVAQMFAPGEIVLVQTHYLNTDSAPLHASIDFKMELRDPATITTEAGVLFFYNPAIYVPAASKHTAELSCPLPETANLAFATSHMHWRGVKFRAESTDPALTASLGPLFETSEWSEPVPRAFPADAPAVLPAGSSIQYHCDFDNPEPTGIVQGLSADTNEMCMFVGMYWPRQARATEFCFAGAVTSAGTASALETLKCMVACGGKGDAACTGPCWDAACPKASTAVMAITRCLGNACSPDCYLAPEGKECATCAKAKCPEEYERFVNTSCQ
ncbi:MAG: hypothetical protein IPI67_08250 [Myxococcales bacterium]|nr:hypothetical protein [Myxococcales bacterium]